MFLNTFTETIENKISTASSKITQLEILLSVLEAKLNSIPGLESTLSSEVKESTDIANIQNSSTISTNIVPQEEKISSNLVELDEAYGPFMKMIKVGIPRFVVQAKAAAAGLDPNVLENYSP